MWTYRQLEEVSRWGSWHPVELDGRVIGDLMVRVEDAWGQREVADDARNMQAELGWTLDPSHGGHGFATEAVQEALRLCFDELRLHRVVADAFAANAPSCRLAERVGMRRELYGVKDSLHRGLGWIDGVGYALLADEWRARTKSA